MVVHLSLWQGTVQHRYSSRAPRRDFGSSLATHVSLRGRQHMRWYMKFFVGAIAATALVALLAGSASAKIYDFDERRIRVVFAPLQLASPAASQTISCNVTLEGTFHASTINKVVNSLIGYI